MEIWIFPLLLFFVILSESTAQSLSSSSCKDGFMEVHFSRVSGDAVCQVRVSDESMKTNGLVLALIGSQMGYTINGTSRAEFWDLAVHNSFSIFYFSCFHLKYKLFLSRFFKTCVGARLFIILS